GLGPFGEAELIMNEPPASPTYLRARKIWGERVKTTVTGASVSAHLSGTLKLALPGLLPGGEVTAVSLEFGTHSPKAVFLALRTENWQHHNSEKTTATDRADGKKELLRVFYPATTQWNQSVLRQGRTMIRKAMDMFRH
ncbi:MAG: M14 family metallopeptidase, partial [Desulfobacterales bacterium]|nr:M14 family metallopeptidase [Desulfobacterales bacterium]